MRSIEVGQQALAMAEQMGLDELRAHALDSIGISRARIGDERGIADLEQSIALAVAHNSLESVRGYANLGNAMVEYGDLARAFELYQQGRDAAQRFGDVDRILWFEVERMYECYWRGLWDEAQRLADEIVSQVDAGSPSSSEHDARLVRARIRLGRGQEPPALDDSTRALELGRHAGYPEMLVPSLALQARVLEAAGRGAEASQLADELLAIWPDRCPTSYWVSDLAFTLRQVGQAGRAGQGRPISAGSQPLAGCRPGAGRRRRGRRGREVRGDRLPAGRGDGAPVRGAGGARGRRTRGRRRAAAAGAGDVPAAGRDPLSQRGGSADGDPGLIRTRPAAGNNSAQSIRVDVAGDTIDASRSTPSRCSWVALLSSSGSTVSNSASACLPPGANTSDPSMYTALFFCGDVAHRLLGIARPVPVVGRVRRREFRLFRAAWFTPGEWIGR